MAITVISVKEKKGEFQGKSYHNFNIFGLSDESTNEQLIAGAEVKEFKIKADRFAECLNRNIGALGNPSVKKVQDIIGLYIMPVYNEFGNVIDFTLSIPDKKK